MDKDLSNYQRWIETCQQFEKKKYEMTSDEFLLKFKSGESSNLPDYFDWFAAKRGIDLQAKHTPIT